MTEFETRVTQLTVMPKGGTTYSDMATYIAIDDEAAGEFVTLSQSRDSGAAKVRIDADEWPALRAAIDRMIAECRPEIEGHA